MPTRRSPRASRPAQSPTTPRWAATGMPAMRAAMTRVFRANRDEALKRALGYPEAARDTLTARAAELEEMAATIAGSPCWWVTAPMTELALDASTDLPHWTPAAAAPHTSGLLLWEAPLPPVPYLGAPDAAHTVGPLGDRRPPEVPVAGISWAPMPDGSAGLEVSVLAREQDLPEGSEVPAWRGIGLMPLFAMEVAADWASGDPTNGLGSDAGWHDGVLAALGATWLLMSQPAITDTTTTSPPPRPPRRPGAPRRPAAPADEVVRIVDLHQTATTTAIAAAQTTTESNRRHRWVVRGHWRQQRYGVGLTQQRPTWIDAYLAGPADAPLLLSHTVRVWRR